MVSVAARTADRSARPPSVTGVGTQMIKMSAEAGTWEIDASGQLCLMFEDKEETAIVCSEQTTPEECSCGDCQWQQAGFGQSGGCVPMQQNPRMKKQVKIAYNKAINLLSSDPDDDLDCMPYTVDASGNIIISISNPSEGWCEEVILTKATNTPGS